MENESNYGEKDDLHPYNGYTWKECSEKWEKTSYAILDELIFGYPLPKSPVLKESGFIDYKQTKQLPAEYEDLIKGLKGCVTISNEVV